MEAVKRFFHFLKFHIKKDGVKKIKKKNVEGNWLREIRAL